MSVSVLPKACVPMVCRAFRIVGGADGGWSAASRRCSKLAVLVFEDRECEAVAGEAVAVAARMTATTDRRPNPRQ